MSSLKLLVVEDDLPSLELMTETLLSLQVDVQPISNSQKAATLVSEEKFDGIFLDLEMPGMSGFQIAQIARQSAWNKTTPIVVVTGRDHRETMRQSFATGATFFLQKPIDRHKLIGLFRSVRGPLLANRRRSIRVPLQTDLTCVTGARTVQGRSWNLSQGGMQLEVRDLKIGDSVRITFQFPGSGKNFDASGTVAWSKDDRQGVQFTKMSAEVQSHVSAFIAQNEAVQK